MLARLQRSIALTLLLVTLVWVAGWWHWSPALALAGLALPLAGHGAILAVEFWLLSRQRGDPAPRPSAAQLLSAWWREWCCGVQVFYWRQPLREHAEPDHLPPSSTTRGVVFIHGLFCNRAFWSPWMRQARAMGMAHVAVSLEPVIGPIDGYAAAVDDAVARVTTATGQAPMLVCHSMGGLVARAWLRTPRAQGRAAGVVTIASPHHGTWMARWGHGASARQMMLQSSWLADLRRDEAACPSVPFLCWYSNCDNIVFPVSTATRPGADNRFVAAMPHVGLAFHERVVQETLRHIRAS